MGFSSNIDFTTITQYKFSTSAIGLPDAADTSSVLEMTINESGKYLVFAIGCSYTTGEGFFRYNFRVNDNNPTEINIIDGTRHNFEIAAEYSMLAGDKLQFCAAKQDYIAYIRAGMMLLAVKVG